MTTIIYGVYISGGSYDDAYNNLIKAWSTREAADQHRDQLEKDHEQQVYASNLQHKHLMAWDEQNPTTIPLPKMAKVPHWGGKRKDQITQAMRDERDSINEDNRTRAEEYQELMQQRQDQWNAECINYLASVGVSADVIIYITENRYFDKDVSYNVEEIEFD